MPLLNKFAFFVKRLIINKLVFVHNFRLFTWCPLAYTFCAVPDRSFQKYAMSGRAGIFV
jgi:hypothetical protein